MLHVYIDAVHQGMGHALGHRCLAPGQVLYRYLAAFTGILGRQRQQAFGGIGAPVENYILDAIQ